jgi:hypothetical protein
MWEDSEREETVHTFGRGYQPLRRSRIYMMNSIVLNLEPGIDGINDLQSKVH